MNSQDDLFSATTAQQFDAWRQTPGGKHLLKHAYAIAAPLIARTPPGEQLSVKLVWELLRHKYRAICHRLERRGIHPQKVNGFALNNIFTAYLARHMMAHRPDWAGRFQLRELNRVKPTRTITITEPSKGDSRAPQVHRAASVKPSPQCDRRKASSSVAPRSLELVPTNE